MPKKTKSLFKKATGKKTVRTVYKAFKFKPKKKERR